MLISLWGHISYFLSDFKIYLIIIFIATFISALLVYIIYKSHTSDNKKKIFLVIIFTIVSLVYVYTGFEAYFRYRFDISDSLGFLRVSQRWYQRHVVYNNYQYRDKNFNVEKTVGKVRIGVMGDSNAFGYGIKNVNDRFSNKLEKKLNDNGYNVEVYNFSVPGYDTEQEIREYQRVEKFNFDIIIWSYFLNDIEEASNSAGEKFLQASGRPPSWLINALSENSYFFDYIYWRLDAKYDKTFLGIRNADLSQYDEPNVFNHHKQQINSFSADLESKGKKIVVTIFPFFYFFPNYSNKAIQIHQEMDRIFQDDGAAAVVDMLNYVKGKSQKQLIVGPYDSHPNEYVHNLTADKLYNAIVPLLEKNGKLTTVKQ